MASASKRRILAAKRDQIMWAIFGVFWAAEAVLVAGLFQSGSPPKGFLVPVVCIVGGRFLSSGQ